MARHARLDWIGLWPERRASISKVTEADVDEAGLIGDHARGGKRAIALLQAEHLSVIAAFLGRAEVTPAQLRRNLLVYGLNLFALRKGVVQIGSAVIEIQGPCPPCSRMEQELGHSGYNAMRGHGGWYASVIAPGKIGIGDTVRPDF